MNAVFLAHDLCTVLFSPTRRTDSFAHELERPVTCDLTALLYGDEWLSPVASLSLSLSLSLSPALFLYRSLALLRPLRPLSRFRSLIDAHSLADSAVVRGYAGTDGPDSLPHQEQVPAPRPRCAGRVQGRVAQCSLHRAQWSQNHRRDPGLPSF